MQVTIGDNLHLMSNPVFWEKYISCKLSQIEAMRTRYQNHFTGKTMNKYFKMSSAESFTQSVKSYSKKNVGANSYGVSFFFFFFVFFYLFPTYSFP